MIRWDLFLTILVAVPVAFISSIVLLICWFEILYAIEDRRRR